MAYGDYEHCEICDEKAIYNGGETNWQYGEGDLAVLCADCAKTDSVGVKSVIIHSPEAEAYWRERIAGELEEGHIVTEMGIEPYREWFPQAAAFVRNNKEG